MRRTEYIASALLLLIWLSACSSTEHFTNAKEINEECRIEMQAALTAIHLRDEGKPKATLLKPLPAIDDHSSRLLINMYAIADETYRYPDLNDVIYPTYRFTICQRALQQKPYPLTFAMIEPALLDCQQQYGRASSAQSTQCVTDAIDKFANTNKPAVTP